MRAWVAVGASILLLVVSGLAFSILLLPLAAAAQSIFCIDITDESRPLQERQYHAQYGCGSDEEVKNLGFNDGSNRPGFGYWFTLLHEAFLGVSEGEFKILGHMANEVGNHGEGLLHIKMCAAYLGKIWFSGWLMAVLLLFLPRVDVSKVSQVGMRAVTAIGVSIALLVISGLAVSILLLPLAALAQSTFCIDVADQSINPGMRAEFVYHGCGSPDEIKDIGGDGETHWTFGYWFTLLHAELLGVSEGEFKALYHIANSAGNDGEGLLHIKLVAVYLGQIWFAGWLAVFMFVLLPRTSAWKAMTAPISTGSTPPMATIVTEPISTGSTPPMATIVTAPISTGDTPPNESIGAGQMASDPNDQVS